MHVKLLQKTQQRSLTARAFLNRLLDTTQTKRQTIVLPEPEDERILRAAVAIHQKNISDVAFVGRPDEILKDMNHLQIDHKPFTIIDNRNSNLRDKYAELLFQKRKAKGMTHEKAYSLLDDPPTFGTLMVACGDMDGMVSGACHTSADTIRPALQLIGSQEKNSIVSSLMFMLLEKRVVVYADCALQVSPTSEELAQIATSSASTSKAFGLNPSVALLSYATGMSNDGPSVSRVRQAVNKAKELITHTVSNSSDSTVHVNGPLQYDAAFSKDIAKQKGVQMPDDTTVFVFPDLNCGNITYKAVQQSTGCMVLGPVLQGLNRPVNDLSRGCTVDDVINTVAVTAVQAINSAKAKFA